MTVKIFKLNAYNSFDYHYFHDIKHIEINDAGNLMLSHEGYMIEVYMDKVDKYAIYLSELE